MNPGMSMLKALLPNTEVLLPILRGPLRGGKFYANPRVSARKVFGLYESELNPWLREAVRRADMVIDVGANDGYFTFGCASAMRRHGKPVRVLAFEPQAAHVKQLEMARESGGFSANEVKIIPRPVGALEGDNMVTLDQFAEDAANVKYPLLKIDVEGAEIQVLEGASKWLSKRTMLLIEVHRQEFLMEIPRRLTDIVGPLAQVDQKALPFLGRETRDLENWWLVSTENRGGW